MTKIQQPSCSLCGQPVVIAGFVLAAPEGQKQFCCAGCRSVFQLLNPEQISSNPSPETLS